MENVVKEAIVLAGGLGTRLREVVSDVPKPMADINGKPFLHYIFEYLSKNNIYKVVLAVGYRYEVITKYFGDRYLDIDIEYSIEDKQLGTGGAIKNALNRIMGDYCFVINGDTYFAPSLDRLILRDTKIVLALKYMINFDRYGSIILEGDYIDSFLEKKYFEDGFINGGIYYLSKDIFLNFNLPDIFSFEKFLEDNFKKLRAKGIIFDEYFVDIGIPSDYELCKKFLKNN